MAQGSSPSDNTYIIDIESGAETARLNEQEKKKSEDFFFSCSLLHFSVIIVIITLVGCLQRGVIVCYSRQTSRRY